METTSIGVISEEHALAETLLSELPLLSITPIPVKEVTDYLQAKNWDVLVIDSELEHLAETISHPALIILTRPVRLKDAISVIFQHIDKTDSGLIELAPDCNFSPSQRSIYSQDKSEAINLTEKESQLLHALLQASEGIGREVLLQEIWGYGEAIDTHTLETHIYRLRGKLRQASEKLDIVFSEDRGYGVVVGRLES